MLPVLVSYPSISEETNDVLGDSHHLGRFGIGQLAHFAEVIFCNLSMSHQRRAAPRTQQESPRCIRVAWSDWYSPVIA
jgi:hypothetical protein